MDEDVKNDYARDSQQSPDVQAILDLHPKSTAAGNVRGRPVEYHCKPVASSSFTTDDDQRLLLAKYFSSWFASHEDDHARDLLQFLRDNGLQLSRVASRRACPR